MRRIASLPLAPLLAATLLVGCQGFNLPITGAGARYNQLAFSPAGQNTLSMLGSQKATEQGRVAAPTAPAASGAAGDAAMSMPAMAPMPYFYGGYWGNEYELVSTSEAKTAGYQGSYQQTLDSVVRPMVNDWATDAVLRNAGGLTDTAGVNVKPSPSPSSSVIPSASAKPEPAVDMPAGMTKPAVMPYVQPPTGWRFEFASRGKRESLHFFVTADSTLVVKQAYRERIQDLSGAKLNSTDVIAIVTKAIQDKSIQANDPYMPQSGSGGGSTGVGIAVPAVAVAPPAPMKAAQTNPSTPVTSGPGGDPIATRPAPAMPTTEELTTVPPNARWDLNLYLEPLPNQSRPDGTNPTPMQTRLVWNVSMQMDDSQANTPGVGYNPGWARVDANTGALLNLSRPHKYTYPVNPTSEPLPMPMPVPGASAGTTDPAVSAGPAPSASPKS